jgi:hypothetical protein
VGICATAQPLVLVPLLATVTRTAAELGVTHASPSRCAGPRLLTRWSRARLALCLTRTTAQARGLLCLLA